MKKGFTLIEIMMTIGLLTLVFGLSVPNYLKSQKVQKVAAATEELRELYILAQNNANSGKNLCPVGEGLQGWAIVVTNPNIQLRGSCGNNANPEYPSSSSTFSVVNKSVPSGVSVSTTLASPNNGILFRVGGQGIYPPLIAGAIITVTVTHSSDGSISRSFTIDGNGRIQ